MSGEQLRQQTNALSKIKIIDYVPHIILTRHWDGRLFCTNSGDLSTFNRDGKNKTQIYNFQQNGYPDRNVDRAIVLPSGTMLVALTNYSQRMIIMRSTTLDYKNWEVVNDDWVGGMLYESWAYAPDGTMVAGEYTTGSYVTNVRVWKVTNDGRNWEVIHTFTGRQGTGDKVIYHIHTVGYDPYTGVFWVGTGDTDPEPGVWRYDGENFTSVGQGTQYWRQVSFTFTEDYVYWGTDGGYWIDGEYKCFMVRFNKQTEELEILSPVNTIFVTEQIEGDYNAKFISNGDPNNKIYLSNNGTDWYQVFEWEHDENVPYPPWRVFLGFVDGKNGRFYGYVRGILRHDTKEPADNVTVIFEIEDETETQIRTVG